MTARNRVLAKLGHLAHLYAVLEQLSTGLVDVVDDELQALQRAGGHFVAEALGEDDGAARAGWRQLHDPDRIADHRVVVDVEAELISVEGLGTVHIGHRDHYDFQGPVHDASSLILVISSMSSSLSRSPDSRTPRTIG